MKKIVLLTLALAMVVSMVGCGCDHQWQDATCQTPKTCALCGKTEGEADDHTPGELEVASVDTETLTITHNLPCSVCSTVIETKESSTGIAPVNGVMPLSAEEWFDCLAANIQVYGAKQTLLPYPTESEDNALVEGIVSLSGAMGAITFRDSAGNTLTTEQGTQRGLVKTICMDAQFTNASAQEFYMLLMLMAINNNSALTPDDSSAIAGKIMALESVSNNGYTYSMQIVSIESQTVQVLITVE